MAKQSKQNKYKLDKADINVLSDYEQHFRNAKNGYMRGVYSSDISRLDPIYRKLGFKLSSPNCGSCVIGMLTKLGEIYNDINGKEKSNESK